MQFGSMKLTKWVVKCTKCDHEFTTGSCTPSCSKCGSRAYIKWIKEKE